ncbi:MAG: helix-turn-helix domain-containing protein [Eubacteriaceae bacterium]|jgi:predicted transcriptional regulator|nr:helix-turn-helix domain-containing protein [Eubacteriaceae bacterium]
MYQKLKNTICERNITVNRLAKMANITPQDLYAAVKGQRPFFPSYRKRISEALRVSEDELFEEPYSKEFTCK